MLCECHYDPLRDKGETSQSGFVVLSELLSNGIVPAGLNVVAENFNDIDDPKSIYGKPSDQFEAMTMARDLSKRGAEAQRLSDERKAAQAAANV